MVQIHPPLSPPTTRSRGRADPNAGDENTERDSDGGAGERAHTAEHPGCPDRRCEACSRTN